MCRLFGSRSRGPQPIDDSLLTGENALLVQSREHRDGWGIGWWENDTPAPRLERGPTAAFADEAFAAWARKVSAPAVLAHLRLASVGPVHLDNAHPFRHGSWLFAHNGTIAGFSGARGAIEAEIDPRFRSVIVGETDSVRCFGVFLTRLSMLADLEGNVALDAVARALGETVSIVAGLADPGQKEPSATTFLVGNGRLMLACRRGRTLFYSTDRTAGSKGEPASGETVERLLVASEPLSTSREWREVPLETMIGIDGDLRVHRFRMDDWAIKPSARPEPTRQPVGSDR